ncbi:MATE family efflux transporter [Leptospira interrogans]
MSHGNAEAAGAEKSAQPITHRDVLLIAVPIMLSNATTPLIGFVDTVVIGQMGLPHLIGGVAVGATIFNFLYWSFAFLRMGTTGLTAQALGARDASEIAANLHRALIVAVAAGVAMIITQSLIAWAALQIMGASAAVEEAARTYFEIRIWAAPAGLINFALLGWFIGLGRTGLAFWVQIFLNVMNMLLAVLLVMGLDYGVAGVGTAALVSEWAAAILGLFLAYRELLRRGAVVSVAQVLSAARIKRTFQVNSDIMIRTLCAITVVLFFTAQGARSGDLTLAANAILQSLVVITSNLLDGFAFAAESLVGRAIGARARARFEEAIRLSMIWAAVVGTVLSLAIWVAGPTIIDFMTTSPEVRELARAYLFWVMLTPIIGVWCFQLDGVFIGATRTADMRNMMIVSVAIFFAAWAVLSPQFGNHGLWAATMIFYIARTLTLLGRYPALTRSSFPAAGAT